MFKYYKLLDEAGIVPKLPIIEPHDYVYTFEDLSQIKNSSELTAFPNLFRVKTLISFNVEQEEIGKVSVNDMTGKEILVLKDGILSASLNIFSFDQENLSAGVFFCTLVTKSRNEIYELIYLPDNR